jgi:hypothetical protein
MRVNILIAVLVLLSFATTGCGTAARWGAHNNANVDRDLKQLAKHFNSATAIDDYYAGAQTEKERNTYISNRLVVLRASKSTPSNYEAAASRSSRSQSS